MSLHGPSKTIVVEPLEAPAVAPVPVPPSRPAREPEPARTAPDREAVPASR